MATHCINGSRISLDVEQNALREISKLGIFEYMTQ